MVTCDELDSLKWEYNVPRAINFKVLPSDKGVVDPEGYAYKVQLYTVMFSDGLQLPFGLPVHDVLDMTSMAPA